MSRRRYSYMWWASPCVWVFTKAAAHLQFHTHRHVFTSVWVTTSQRWNFHLSLQTVEADVPRGGRSQVPLLSFPRTCRHCIFPNFKKGYKQPKGAPRPVFLQHVSRFLSVISQLLPITLVKMEPWSLFRKMAIFQSSLFIRMWLSIPGLEATGFQKRNWTSLCEYHEIFLTWMRRLVI